MTIRNSLQKEIASHSPKGLAKRLLIAGITGAVLFAILLFSTTFLINFVIGDSIYQSVQERGSQTVNSLKEDVESILHLVRADLNYLSSSKLTKNYLLTRNETERTYLENQMSLIMVFQDFYDQVRILDTSGMELIRINKGNNKSPNIVPKDMLQNKSGRYYFDEALELPPDVTYISAFDLNIENGLIEEPHKPMIRFSRQIRDEQDEIIGVAILNFLGRWMQDDIRTVMESSTDNIFLLNEESYYLYHHNPDRQFGFMFNDTSNRFSMEFPEVWTAFKDGLRPVKTAYSGTFIPVKILIPSSNSTGKEWLLVLQLTPETLKQSMEQLNQGILIGTLALLPVLCFLGFSYGRNRVYKNWYTRELERLAQTDTLTGLYNRLYIQEHLRDLMDRTKRSRTSLSVAFIDVNYLKQINDKQGHEAGDTLIKGAAETIRKQIRITDAAARIGGDEFLIILPDCPIVDAQSIMNRIAREFSQQGTLSDGTPWSISFGCTQYNPELDTMERLINRADDIMYNAKKAFKRKQAKDS